MADEAEVLWRSQNPTTENQEQFRGPYSIQLPNERLREASSVANLGWWYSIGEAWAHTAQHYMPSTPTVLDVGCGCGKMARFFVLNPHLTYIGLDVYLPSVLWCKREFARYADRFSFEHVDAHSSLYNPTGAVDPSEVALPVRDHCVDLVIAGSLFTHLLEPAARHYLAEFARCLKHTGKALISLHMEPTCSSGFSGSETRIDMTEARFAAMATAANLVIHGRIGNVFGQQLYAIAHGRS